jgi:plasmid stability protein
MNVPVNLSIKNVPDNLAEALRLRAAASHRSMQGELMAILERALQEERQLTPAAVLARVRELAIRTDSEAVDMLRKDRNER